MAEANSCTTQLIDGDGEFNAGGLETFTRTVKLSELGLSYAVVAIIGPQSSGKSTLLNHLFNTDFREMDAFKGRSQTTKGIWIARAVGIAPCTVIMDVEGSDGKERGKKDETAFEKQSALFALAVSDVVLINMWCHDIGREQAAYRPLLKTVFQVMMQLFSPRKTTLLFVIRDKTKTPFVSLEASLREDMQQIWDTVQKPQAFKDTPLSEFFNVEVTALSSYEEKQDQFKEQVGQLRQRFFNSIAPGGLAGDRRGVVPASGFSNWSEKIWKDIKENRDLDLPAHRGSFRSQPSELEFQHLLWSTPSVLCERNPTPKALVMAEENSCTTQLIYGDGEFNAAGLETFTRTVKLSELGLSYAVVAIIGPQSSGKSTLLNHLFNTDFREMDAFKGRSQTTKGIWIARAVGIAPCTVIMDVEGSDGKERGKKDETAFEKQSTLFALAVSDVVLINMWCHDIGREQAANRPLLKTVFQVMMQLFSPRKTTLLFVIRDKTKTPFVSLEASLREDMQQIWDTVQKPQAFKDTPLSEFFNVEVTALSSYEEKEDQFKEQVGQLRQRFFNSIAPGGLAGDRRGVVPASGFSNWSEKIWKDIKENRDLDLPAHRVMLASVRCDEIGSEQLTRLTSDESWLSLEEAAQAGLVPGFVQRLSSILETYLSEYDTMTLYYDENVSKAKRQEFESKALQLVRPSYDMFLQHLRSETLESFKTSLEQTLHKGEEFDSSVGKYTQACMEKFDFSCTGEFGQQTYWDASKVRGELLSDILATRAAYELEFYTTNYLHHNIQKTQKKRSEMAPAFPKYVVLQSKHDMKYLAVAEDADAFTAGGDQVLSPLSKFNLEKAKTKKGFFNIRSCYNNKYVAKEGAAASSSIVVGAAEPNEDPSQWSSTLIELVPTAGDVTSVQIRLVYSHKFIDVEGETQFTVINWESLMNLPRFVVLKADNGKYLQVKFGLSSQKKKKNGLDPYGRLKFDGSDIGDLALVHQVLPVGDGTIMMKPMLQPFTSAIHWHCWTAIGRIRLNYPPSRFMPVKAGSNRIALRCMDNNLFCRICNTDCNTENLDNLVADSESITKESRFIVEEPLLSRDIFDVDFRLKHARIYDQDVVTMNTRDATNLTSSAETFNLRLTYTETSTRTWDRSLGLKLGSSATMKAGVPLIAQGEVKLSADFEGSYKWGDKQETSKEMETIHTVNVPPKTRVKATLLATKGKCEVPFSYTVRDVLIDGQEFIHILDDGIYTGTNDYNFKVETTEEKLL